MLLELHAHTKEHSPCSLVSAVDLVRRIHAKGLQGIVFTDHHYLWTPDEIARIRRYSEVPDHFVIFPGQEMRSQECGDVLIYGADHLFPRDTSLETVRRICPDAAIVWAHPYRRRDDPSPAQLTLPLLDAIEIFNANHTTRGNMRALNDWHRLRFTAIGGTDTHAVSYAGTYPTIFDHPVTSVQELAAEIRAGRCRPFLKEIPHAGANSVVTEVTIGTKGYDEVRERIVVRELTSPRRWRAAERAHRIIREIADHGFAAGRFRVPLPIDEDPAAMTLIEQGLRGKSLYDRVVSGSVDDVVAYIRLSSQWLARLHESRLQVTPADEFLAREEQRLARYLARFSDIDHTHTHKAQAIHDAVLAEESRMAASDAELFVQAHGDFHPKNIIIGYDNNDRTDSLYVAAIDFESSYCMPRAFDVGCFLAQCRSQFQRLPQVLALVESAGFLQAYTQSSTALNAEFTRQVELFRARTNLSIAAYLIKVGLGDSDDLWRVLVEADHSLCAAQVLDR